MMKKFVVIITLLAMAISLCACSNSRDKIILHEGEFTVIRTEWTYGGHHVAILEYNNKRVLIRIDAAEFACWDEGDTVIGLLTSDQSGFSIGEKSHFVCWSQEVAEMQ